MNKRFLFFFNVLPVSPCSSTQTITFFTFLEHAIFFYINHNAAAAAAADAEAAAALVAVPIANGVGPVQQVFAGPG